MKDKLSPWLKNYRIKNNISLDKPVRKYENRAPKDFMFNGKLYRVGKVYKVNINNSDVCYIGSTTQYIDNRVRCLLNDERYSNTIREYMIASGYTYEELDEVIFEDGNKNLLTYTEYLTIQKAVKDGLNLTNKNTGKCKFDPEYEKKYQRERYHKNKEIYKGYMKKYKETHKSDRKSVV